MADPRKSTRLRTFIGDAYKLLFTGGEAVGYSGSRPSSADAAPTGTKLVTFTLGAAARTAGVTSYGTITLTGGGSGSVDTVTVTPTGGSAINLIGAAVPYNSSLTQTAADVATAINAYVTYPRFRATSSGAVITVLAMPNTGTVPNTWALASTVTTITKTDANFANGVASVNGLTFLGCIDGVLNLSGTWQGTGLATGTLGYIRLKGTIADDDSLDSTNKKFIRYDLSVGLSGSGANIIVSDATVTLGNPYTLDSGGITIPAGA